jgi:hypothetical protein
LWSTSSWAAPSLRRGPQPTPPQQAHVYLMRGFMNVFSLGMDDLAVLIRNRGIDTTVANHADYEDIDTRIVRNYSAGDHGPIILIGHSLGADIIVTMARMLYSNTIPVALLVLFDGTVPQAVPSNVTTAVNFTLKFDLTPGDGFHGTLSNVDMRTDGGIDHLNIDKSPALQQQTLQYVMQAATPSKRPDRTH